MGYIGLIFVGYTLGYAMEKWLEIKLLFFFLAGNLFIFENQNDLGAFTFELKWLPMLITLVSYVVGATKGMYDKRNNLNG